MQFCDKLKKLRTDNRLTQEELAEKIYVTRNAVSKWETGKGYPSLDSLKLLAALFGVSIDELLSDDELNKTKLADDRRAKKFYCLAVACIAATVAFVVAAYSADIPWLTAGSFVFIAGYVCCAYFTTPRYQRNETLKYHPMAYILPKVAVAVLLATVTIAQLCALL